MKTTELTIANVTSILNWYALECSENWGTWGRYPSLPVGASYDSFDTCHLRITFTSNVSFNGESFNCIADRRHVPGKNLKSISINRLAKLCKAAGVEFVNEYMTADKAAELANKRLADAGKTVADFEIMATYEFQRMMVREQIMSALDSVVVAKEFGKSIPESINGHSLTVKNYCQKEEATFIVDLTLEAKNSRKTAGKYVAASIDIEEAVTRFTNERVAVYSANLERHKQTLAELQA